MSTPKAFIFTVEDSETKEIRTFLIQRYIDSELIPKFEVAVLTGEHKTRSQFRKAYKNQDLRFDLLSFYPADFRRFIEKCESLEEP